MKLAVATPEQAGTAWTPFPTDFARPREIRSRIEALALLDRDEAHREAHGEVRIATMNRTVLDMVLSSSAKNVGPLAYEDVLVWVEARGELVPLLTLFREEYLSHFELGMLYDREEF